MVYRSCFLSANRFCFAPIAIIKSEEILVIASRESRGTSRSRSAWNWYKIAPVQCASSIHMNHFSFHSNDALKKISEMRAQRMISILCSRRRSKINVVVDVVRIICYSLLLLSQKSKRFVTYSVENFLYLVVAFRSNVSLFKKWIRTNSFNEILFFFS